MRRCLTSGVVLAAFFAVMGIDTCGPCHKGKEESNPSSSIIGMSKTIPLSDAVSESPIGPDNPGYEPQERISLDDFAHIDSDKKIEIAFYKTGKNWGAYCSYGNTSFETNPMVGFGSVINYVGDFLESDPGISTDSLEASLVHTNYIYIKPSNFLNSRLVDPEYRSLSTQQTKDAVIGLSTGKYALMFNASSTQMLIEKTR